MYLRYQAAENTLRLSLDDAQHRATRHVALDGYVDMGEGGRLIGVETRAGGGIDLAHALTPWLADPIAAEFVNVSGGSAYIELSAPEEMDVREHENVRAIAARFAAELDENGNLVALSIPRRGAGYEISYPSGNR